LIKSQNKQKKSALGCKKKREKKFQKMKHTTWGPDLTEHTQKKKKEAKNKSWGGQKSKRTVREGGKMKPTPAEYRRALGNENPGHWRLIYADTWNEKKGGSVDR